MDFETKNNMAYELLRIIDSEKFPRTYENLKGFIESNEIGVFLEEICTFVDEENISLTTTWIQSMKKICKEIGIKEIYWSGFSGL